VGRFQLIVGRRENRDEIVLKAELKDDVADKANIAEELNRRFQDACRLRLDNIEFVVAGAIPDSGTKVVDARKWE